MARHHWLTGLKLCAGAVLLGRGWLTWRWDSPIRGLIWNEGWWSGWLEKFTGLTWTEFARQSDSAVTWLLTGIGLFLCLCGTVPWLMERPRLRWTRWLLWAGAFFLGLDSFARWIDHGRDLGMAIEHTLQIATPVALFLVSRNAFPSALWIPGVRIAAALTFTGHGLYAAGFHPVPLSYQTMTMTILGIGRESTLVFLGVAGWLDFLAAAALFWRPVRCVALGYMVFWGGATALARIVSHFGPDYPMFGVDPWLAETIVRTPHWAMPLLLLLLPSIAMNGATEKKNPPPGRTANAGGLSSP